MPARSLPVWPTSRTTVSMHSIMRREIGLKPNLNIPTLNPCMNPSLCCACKMRPFPSNFHLIKNVLLPTFSFKECRVSSSELEKCYKRIMSYCDTETGPFTRERIVFGIQLRGRENFPNDPDYVERLTNELDRMISSNIEMEKALRAPIHDSIDGLASVPCACCDDMIEHPPGKTRTDFLVCGCPSHPLICGPCRNRNVRCICLWCNKPGFCRSTKSQQKGLEINLLAKRWESFRTDYPHIFPLTDNWCIFVRYDQARQTIQRTMEGFANMFGLTKS